MRRRNFLLLGGAGLLGGAAWRYWPRTGFFNACLNPALPPALAQHAVLRAAWQGIDPKKVWDVHVHLIGNGDAGSGAWSNPQLDSAMHPLQFLQKRFYLNAGCVKQQPGAHDHSYVARLVELAAALPSGSKLMLLAFDAYHRPDGKPDWHNSTFYTPNAYAQAVAQAHPQYFEWTASIHPYRADALPALEHAISLGARAVKWLPNAMGIDPASARCDAFYQTLARYDLPLLSHAGRERAVAGAEAQDFGNPLKLRRALDHGVRVILAHCASSGEDKDLDKGSAAAPVASFELFARLMDDTAYLGRVFGEISAMTQYDRAPYLQRILAKPAWHNRLLNGSDYPLPGILPIYSASRCARLGLLDEASVPVLNALQEHHPLLFDFVLKRSLRYQGQRLPASVFETRPFFETRA